MTVFVLKIIAYISMIIDHVTYAFIPQYIGTGQINPVYVVGRSLGRPAFIIFAFLIVEGYFHTRDKFKYAGNLLILAFASELPFDLFSSGTLTDTYMAQQNVMWTLILGYLTVWLVDTIKMRYFIDFRFRYYVYTVGVITVAFVAAYAGRTDYGGIGVLCVLLFFYFWRNEGQLMIGLLVWGVAAFFLGETLELIGVFAVLILLHFYKGEKGPSLKLLFYLIYPVHLLVIGLIVNFSGILALLH